MQSIKIFLGHTDKNQLKFSEGISLCSSVSFVDIRSWPNRFLSNSFLLFDLSEKKKNCKDVSWNTLLSYTYAGYHVN